MRATAEPTNGAAMRGGAFLLKAGVLEETFTPEDFSEQQRLIGNTANEFMRHEVLPRWEQLEHQEPGLMPRLLRKAGELGLLALDLPERFGGSAGDVVSATLVAETMAQYASFAAAFSAHTGIGTLPIAYFGTEEQKQRYLPRLATGELLAAYCLSEAEAGSDALAARTHATLAADGSHFVLNGEKMWISNGGFADLYIVFAKVDGKKFSSFIVERRFPGVSTGREERKMGLKGSSTCALVLENARVPAENLLGELGRGHVVAFNTLNIGRLKLAASSLGAARRAFHLAVEYSRQRRAFGKPICEFGLIQEKLAEMAARLYAGESMLYRTAEMLDEALSGEDTESPDYGRSVAQAMEDYAVECSINKLYLSEIQAYNADECVQIYGGYGYHQDYPAERIYRDARIYRIFEGTSEINRLVITGLLLRRAAKGKLPLLDAAEQTVQQTSAMRPRASSASSRDDLSTEKELLLAARQAVLLLIGLAHRRFGAALAEQQEIVAAISDVVMETFALESAVLRAQKAAQSGDESRAPQMARLARLLVNTRVDYAEQRARAVLAAVAGQNDRPAALSALSALLEREPIGTIGLRRQIAAQVIATGRHT